MKVSQRYFDIIISPIMDEEKNTTAAMVVLNEQTEEIEKTERIKNLLKLSIQVNKINEMFYKEKLEDAITKLIQELKTNPRYGCIHIIETDENQKIKKISFYSPSHEALEEIRTYYTKEFIDEIRRKRVIIQKDVVREKYPQHKKEIQKHMSISIALSRKNEFYGIFTIHMVPEEIFYKDEIQFLIGMSKIITDAILRKKSEELAEEKRKEIEQYYFGFEKSAISRVLVEYRNKEPVILRVNKAFEDLYGYTLEEALGKNPRILKSGKTPLRIYKEMWKSILNPKKGHWEGQIINKTKDGKLVSVKLIIDTLFENGKAKFFFANHIDMTKEIELIRQINETKQYFENMFNSSKDAIVIGDNNLKFEKVNRAFEELTGYKEKEIIGKEIHKLLNPGIYDINSKRLKKFKIEGESDLINKTVEIQIKDKKGNNIPVSLSISKFIHEGEIKLIASLRDIRIQKAIENELREKQALFESIFEKSSSGMVVYEPIQNGKHFVIKDINEYACNLEKVKREEIVGKLVDKVFPGIHKMGLFKYIQEVYKTGKEKLNLIQYYKDKEREGWRVNNIIKLPTDYLLVIYQDITERKKMQDEILESRNRLNNIIQNSSDLIYTISTDGIILNLNPSVEKMLGYKPEELIGKHISFVLEKGSLKDAMKRIEIIKKRKTPPIEEMKFIAKDGKIVIGAVSSSPLIEKNKIIGSVGTIRDITKQKEIEETMKNYTERLEKEVKERTYQLEQEMKKTENLAKVKDEFIRNMTHELKTPTSVILGNLELLKKMAPIGKEKEWYNMIEMLQRNATRLSESINQILNLTRISEIDLHYENVVINDILKEIREEYLPIADKKGLQLEVGKEIIAIKCDRELIKLAISNLVSNAIKFTQKGNVSIDLRSLDGHIQIIVSDTGIGMDEETKKHIFERFYKADPNAPGTGIGLTIVKEIIEKHKGKIEVESRPGKGSKFIVTLPRSNE